MWISRKKWKKLEKRVADLEKRVQDQSVENIEKFASDLEKAFLMAADKIQNESDIDASVEVDKRGMDVQTELKKLPDKILHCLARTIQDGESGSNVKCLYCKYAPECSEECIKSHSILLVELMKGLEECTSVDIFQHSTSQPDFLKGSWAEKYPDVLKMLTSKSFEEQLDSLRDPDILLSYVLGHGGGL